MGPAVASLKVCAMSLVLLSLLLAGPLASAAEPAPPAAPAPIAQGAMRNVPVGDPQRGVLLDTIRPGIQARVGQPVQFMVDTLRIQGDWAFYAGSIQQPNGRPIDFSRTSYAEQLEEGMFDGPGTYALLQRTGGHWRLVDFVVGPTDMYHYGWPEEYGVPMSLVE
ncbi:hypothetical protein [Brevundimonas sp.]|uniref:hypothetical protein n=1 Tax=Brevundimonas sp. TaxID=1871086 RepID=UPI003D1080B8